MYPFLFSNRSSWVSQGSSPRGPINLCQFPLLSHHHPLISVFALFTLWVLHLHLFPVLHSLGLPPNGSPGISTCLLPINSSHSCWNHLFKMQINLVTSPPCLACNFKGFPLSLVERPKHFKYPKCLCTI